MYSCTPEHNNWELFQMKIKYGDGGAGGGSGVGGLKAKYYIFVGGGGAVFFSLFSNPVGGWLLWKFIIFCRWWSFSKVQFCGYLLFKWDLLEWSLGYCEKLIPGENIVLYTGKFRLKPRLFLLAFFSGKFKPRHIFGTSGTHRRLNLGT